ncbi:MAG: hypothetical protein LBI86_05400 [Treponema sp.]|jgi:hypothetical protein|nr:hypothetical protein [Treponema sp.]
MNVYRIRPLGAAFFLAGILLVSCASAPAEVGEKISEQPPASFLPLVSGWYLYEFERTFKGIEDEYTFAQSTGMPMVEEVTVRQSGTVTYCEEGVLHDPVLDMYLSVDGDGLIHSIENPTVSGALSENGAFFWSGLSEQNGRTNHVAVKGSLISLPPPSRGDSRYDGLYHLTDTGTGREQLALIKDGFYTWTYIDGEEAGFTPWPTLIRPDGSFGFDMEWTTVLEMGDSKADYSTGFTAEGRIDPASGISLEVLSHTAGAASGGGERPEIYTGVMALAAEFSNEQFPVDVTAALPAAIAVAKESPAPDWSGYPAWYLNPPVRGNAVFGVGQKTFSVRDTAFAMAEAAAAADIALRLRMRIESRIEEAENSFGRRAGSVINVEAMERIPYRVAERIYREETGTAFVLLELDL